MPIVIFSIAFIITLKTAVLYAFFYKKRKSKKVLHLLTPFNQTGAQYGLTFNEQEGMPVAKPLKRQSENGQVTQVKKATLQLEFYCSLILLHIAFYNEKYNHLHELNDILQKGSDWEIILNKILLKTIKKIA